MRVLVNGTWGEPSVSATEIHRERRADPELRRFIDEGWRIQRERMERASRPYSDGPLLRFEGIDVLDDPCQVSFLVSPSLRYRDVVGVRARAVPSHMRMRSALPRPFSVMNVVVSADDRIVLGWRNVGDWEPSFELSGGFVRPDEQPFEASRNRLRDDLGLPRRDLASHVMVCAADCREFGEAFALFVARAHKSSAEIAASASYDRMCDLDDSPDALAKYHEPLHPPSRLALRAYADHVRTNADAGVT